MKMQKYLVGAFVCAMACAATSCSSEDSENGINANGKLVINATATAEPTSRVLLDGVTPNWEASDQIAVKVDADATVNNLTLSQGGGSQDGTFGGTITPTSGTKMYAFYPAAAATATDLTTQTATLAAASKNLVMFASADFSTTPAFAFTNKVSVFKLNLTAPDGITTTDQVTSVIIDGAYSKGTLGTDGTWGSLTVNPIELTGVEVSGGKITGYAVVIPGSPIKDLYFTVSTKIGTYKTAAYTNTGNIPANALKTINGKTLTLTNVKSIYRFPQDYYEWDAYEPYGTGSNNFSAGNYGHNPIATGTATHSFRNCISALQAQAYCDAPHYWDDGHTGYGQQTYQVYANGVSQGTYHTGVWFKKGVTPTQSTSIKVVGTHYNYSDWTTDAEIRTSGNYFFVPAMGFGTDSDYYSSPGVTATLPTKEPIDATYMYVIAAISDYLEFPAGGAAKSSILLTPFVAE